MQAKISSVRATHLATDGIHAAAASGFFHQLLDERGDQFRLVLGDQVVDGFRGDAQFLQMVRQVLPVFVAFLAFAQVQLGDQFLNSLQGDASRFS